MYAVATQPAAPAPTPKHKKLPSRRVQCLAGKAAKANDAAPSPSSRSPSSQSPAQSAPKPSILHAEHDDEVEEAEALLNLHTRSQSPTRAQNYIFSDELGRFISPNLDIADFTRQVSLHAHSTEQSESPVLSGADSDMRSGKQRKHAWQAMGTSIGAVTGKVAGQAAPIAEILTQHLGIFVLCSAVSWFAFPDLTTLVNDSIPVHPKDTVAVGECVGVFNTIVGITFASLVSVTLSFLWERQENIRRILHEEAALCTVLLQDIEGLFKDDPDRLRRSVMQIFNYTQDSFFADPDTELRALVVDDPMLNILRLVYELSDSELQSSRYNKLGLSIAGRIGRVSDSVRAISAKRSQRLSAGNAKLPFIHWVNLTILGSTAVFAFLLTTFQHPWDGQRYLFSLLIGSFGLLANILYDLQDLFRGYFTIANLIDDDTVSSILGPLRRRVRQELEELSLME
eukprot:jgi/Chlat1/4725/Chrsp30S04769